MIFFFDSEMKLIHKSVLRQARAMKARAKKKDDDEGYDDVMHEFQDLVKKAVANRRSSRRPSNVDESHLSPGKL